MQLNISQQMKMTQQMRLDPRMIQSMEILQLPIMALQDRIEQELDENVVLENAADDADEQESESADTELQLELEQAREDATAPSADEKELIVDTEHDHEADFERLLEIAADWPEDNISAGSRASSNRVEDAGEWQHDAMANMAARPQSLQEYLLEQFSFFNCDPEIREFGEYLIQNLDHNGRLPSLLPEIVQVYGKPIGRNALQAARRRATAEERVARLEQALRAAGDGNGQADVRRMTAELDLRMKQVGEAAEDVRRCSLDAAQQTLGLIQKLDPPGVGARDYKECLLLQLKPETPYRDVLVTLITSHLEDVGQNRLPVIQRKTGYSLEVIKAAIEELLRLDPYPGRGFEVRPVQRVTPDLTVEQNDDGNYVVRLEDEYVPQLRISPRYLDLLRKNPDAETKDYIRKKVESAKWLIDSIEQRHNTLKRVAQAIVDFQTGFLDNGPEHIVPLKMQQIADIVGVHVTTVSRAVGDKWIQTPRGLFPLKRFFGGGTQTVDGDEVAWDIIRLKLKEVIDGEDKSHPLSDDAIVEELAKQGYNLARRTVTKYRKAMDIPSSRQRREY